MKLLLILFSIFTISNLNEDEISNPDFVNQINSAYEEYALVDEYTNSYYDLQLYVGKIEDKIYYGIYFKNKIPNQPYNLKLSYNNKIFALNKTPRGDVIEPAVDLNNISIFSLEIYDKNNYKNPIPKFTSVDTVDLAEFSSLENIIIGEGNGTNVQRLRADINIDTKLFIYFILVSILLFCGFIILIFYKKKKGMFNADIKSANVFNFREFLKATKEDIDNEYEEAEDKPIYEDSINDKYEEPVEEVKERVISQTYVWQHYEEEKSDFNFKEYLENLNLPSHYSTASIEDKNKVMLELMKLRDQNKITQDDYLDEISELWKN